MKIIDHTPYLSENGEISFTNQILAALKFGYSWYPEIKSQQVVIEILNNNLAKGYTLLRNITLPGSKATIPLILVGPAGVNVIFVTNLKGNYEAKGDNWSLIEGNKVQTTQSNLLVITSRMARAIQRYLDKQGIEISNVDGILVAADPGMHIDSVRPIVRVVLSDAIEHFAVTLNNSSASLDSGLAQIIIRQLTELKINEQQASSVVQSPIIDTALPLGEKDPIPVPEIGELLPWSGDDLGFEFSEDHAQDHEKPFSSLPEPYVEPPQDRKSNLVNSKPLHFDKKQWILLIAFGVVEIIILMIFLWLIFINH